LHDANVPFSRVASALVSRPLRALVVAVVATSLVVPLLLRLRIDADVVDLFPQSSVEAQAFARFSRAFVAEQMLLILVEGDDPARLTRFADEFAAGLTTAPETAPHIAEVRWKVSAATATLLRDHLLSLINEDEAALAAARLQPGAVAAQARRLRGLLSAPGGSSLAPILTADPLELLPKVAARLSHGLPVDAQSGYFRSADGKALMLYIRPRAPTSDYAADRALIDGAAKLAERLGARVARDGNFEVGAQPQIGFTGACAFWMFYQDWLHRDMQLSTVLSGVAVLVLFGLFFRAVRALPLVALPLLVGLVWTAAAAQLLYGRINAVSLAFGTILVSIGIDLPIQLYNRLREELTRQAPLPALETTVRTLAGPSLTATLGPAVVFFACALSSYRGLAELGVLAGIGLMLNWLAMLTVFPALLAALPHRWWARAAKTSVSGGLLGAIGRLAGRHPRRVLLVAALVGVAAAPLALRARFDKRLLAQPRSMPPVRVQAELERRFGERDRALIALVEDGDRDRALARADRWLAAAERLRVSGKVRTYSTTSTLFPSPETQAARRATLVRAGAVAGAARLEQALADAGFDVAPFAPFLRQLSAGPPPLGLDSPAARELGFLVRAHVHDDAAGRSVATYIYPAPGQEAAVIAELQAFARGPAGGVVTGAPVLENVLVRLLEHDSLRVTVVSAVAVALLLALYYRRFRPWLAVMLPLVLAWIGFAAALALLGLPLNLYNLLSVPLVIGYGIDDLVFLVHRYEAEPERGTGVVLATTGRAIVLTSLSTMAGFAGLAVARFDGLRLLGLSGALAVALCLVAAFAVLPAMLTLLGAPERKR
jgi:predicted RND superfamily exporter protein